MRTEQTDFWNGKFGEEYTDRNTYSVTDLDQLYDREYGVTRTAMNKEFIANLPRSIRILEVGCNVGNQLQLLQNQGFTNLFGIELQEYAVEKAKSLTKGINIIQGSAFDIPFKDRYFDLVYTSGVLIHISPQDIDRALKEIYRVSDKFIWGFEYYSDQYEEVVYRGANNKMWKTNFMALYKSRYSDLRTMKERIYKYKANDNKDQMFLLEKMVY